MNTPIEQYTAWARQVYKDDKTRLFPMSAERLCLYVKYKNISPATIPELIQYLAKHPKHGEEWSIKMKEHPSISDFFSIKKTKNQLAIVREPSCVVVEGSKAKGFMIVSNKSITNSSNNTNNSSNIGNISSNITGSSSSINMIGGSNNSSNSSSSSSSNNNNSIRNRANLRVSFWDTVDNEITNTRTILQRPKSIKTISKIQTEPPSQPAQSQPDELHRLSTVKEKVKIAELIAKNKRLKIKSTSTKSQ
ncbi:hypothetical protein BCV72DRAFT_302996 [Rhizopus microsporus var. microsporus]|uniref:Uncharacterized protein n=2 Tax=Rhizopus microsporus TaxID=58291 RepID=A0A2G4T827_RHIZD|nr:uncharacterized protein RHIMIDRAFT_232607 [Rhizopus microsporus ATCC 52813]ORE09246.1 hypothetical protein BCV72DRAFT_302996 [Rhizopus microsporus var. microsporus]PHZ17175.1 hypothetical protein RHIMIDRAFT_232607 [Rhizopus microsporus ATCC 52813]